jgi:hypothetical protein
MNTDKQLLNHVQSIADKLSNGFDGELNDDGEQLSAYDYLADALDIQYLVNSDKTYRSGKVLVAFGGPNIWVDTNDNSVRGYWGGDSATVYFDDAIGLDDCLSELYGM